MRDDGEKKISGNFEEVDPEVDGYDVIEEAKMCILKDELKAS